MTRQKEESALPLRVTVHSRRNREAVKGADGHKPAERRPAPGIGVEKKPAGASHLPPSYVLFVRTGSRRHALEDQPVLLTEPPRFIVRASGATGQSVGGPRPSVDQGKKASTWAAFWAALRKALAALAA
jgi:hypothetical protein